MRELKIIQKWIKEKREVIVDPDNEGYTEFDEEQEFDCEQQTELRLLEELEEFITTLCITKSKIKKAQ